MRLRRVQPLQPSLQSPPVQALCDRLVFEIANLRYLAEVLPERSLERLVPATGWTVRQTFNHIERTLVEYAEVLPRLLDGQFGRPDGFDRDLENASQVRATGTRPLHEILAAIEVDIDALLALIVARANDLETATYDDRPVIVIAAEWAHHSGRHALQAIDALPELVKDPLLLGWLMGSDFGDDDDLDALREKLRKDALAAFGMEHEEGPL